MPKQIRNWKRREHRLFGFHHSDFFRMSGFGIRVFLSSAICEGLTKAGKSSRNNWPPSPGCPAWIRTRTKASKGPCATVTPPDKTALTLMRRIIKAKEKLRPTYVGPKGWWQRLNWF